MGGQLRAPAVHSLLRQLARKANDSQTARPCSHHVSRKAFRSRRLRTSPQRHVGSELQIDLANLTNKAGAALLHHAGADRAGAAKIEPDDAELIAASREVDGHALTLKLLGRFLARAHKGDIRQRDLVSFDAADLQEQGRTTFKMLAAFENWFAKSGEFGQRQLSVLHLMGLFDGPVDSDCLEVLRAAPSIQA